MSRTKALEQALAAWNNNQRPKRSDLEVKDVATVDAIGLGQAGMFSNRHIAAITGLSVDLVCDIVKKSDKTGGRFNPESLPLIFDLWLEYVDGGTNPQLISTIVNSGTSVGFLARLTDIPATSLSRWLKRYNERGGAE
jgi:hypothetical protein